MDDRRDSQDSGTGGLVTAEAESPEGGTHARIEILRPPERHHPFEDLETDVAIGLTDDSKWLPPKYFYDSRGSELFEEITRQPEYYQTRTEKLILERTAASIVAELRPTALVELGSGSAAKTRVLMDAMRDAGLLHGYGPIDVSESALRQSAAELVIDYPDLLVVGVLGDFEHPLELPLSDDTRLVAFLGSTIGNMTREQAVDFLRRISGQLNADDCFLIGFDRVKDLDVLEAAYNDTAGVTREFNLNVLRLINRELDADFDLHRFEHRAFYDQVHSRIEMHLDSRGEQVVRVRAIDLDARFGDGESIRTELSYKYTRRSASDLLADGGLELERWETDPDELFALGIARPV